MIKITPLPEHAIVPDLTEWIEVLHVGELYSIHDADKRRKPCYGVAAFLRRKAQGDNFIVEQDIRTIAGPAVRGSWFPICGSCGNPYGVVDISNAIRVLNTLEGRALVPPDDNYLEVWKEYEKQARARL